MSFNPSGFIHASKGVLKVTIQRIFTSFMILGLAVLVLNVNSLNAQTKVALVDVGMVFKNHPSFSQELESLKSEADKFKEETRQMQAALMEKAGVLKNYQPDSDEFRQAETELAKESAALEVQQRSKLRTLMEREAKLHYDTYMQIKSAVSTYCEQRGIQLVMRHDATPMKADQPGAIMQKVNGKVVFHQPNNEITQQIVAIVAQSAGAERR
jgi:Skp family chaperone for outer membrane proteins